MKTKRVTIKDIAELAGVSKATASLVLNGRGKELRVAQETRERVLAIAREQHYQPSIHARSLRDNRSHTIGLVVPEITNYGFAVFCNIGSNMAIGAVYFMVHLYCGAFKIGGIYFKTSCHFFFEDFIFFNIHFFCRVKSFLIFCFYLIIC